MNAEIPILEIALCDIMVPIPRRHHPERIATLMASLEEIGLKRPITVAARPEGGYVLIGGQARLEAFRALGAARIPALVLDAAAADGPVMGLVETIARRRHTPLDVLKEILFLERQGLSIDTIAAETHFAPANITLMRELLARGELRLLLALQRGVLTAAIATAFLETGDIEQALGAARATDGLSERQIEAIRYLVHQRATLGIGLRRAGRRRGQPRGVPTGLRLAKLHRRELDRQRFLICQAETTRARLANLVDALRPLLRDADVVDLLRVEGVNNLPRALARRLREHDR